MLFENFCKRRSTAPYTPLEVQPADQASRTCGIIRLGSFTQQLAYCLVGFFLGTSIVPSFLENATETVTRAAQQDYGQVTFP